MRSTALRLGSIARTGEYNFSGTVVHRHTGDWLERSPPEVGLAGIHDGTCNEIEAWVSGPVLRDFMTEALSGAPPSR